jgi:hypothetical protein
MIVLLGTLAVGAKYRNDYGEYEVVRQGNMGTSVRKLGKVKRTIKARNVGSDDVKVVNFESPHDVVQISSAAEVTPI